MDENNKEEILGNMSIDQINDIFKDVIEFDDDLLGSCSCGRWESNCCSRNW